MKKKITFEQRRAELKHMLYTNSPLISQSYPGIKSIEIKITFTDPNDGEKFEGKQSYNTDSKAFFRYDCPYRECVNGGYDLKNVIENAIQAPNQQVQERLICQGWQDQKRINKYKCLLEALLTVKINL